MVQHKYSRAEALYAKIKEEVCQRALALDEAFSQSTQVSQGAREGKFLPGELDWGFIPPVKPLYKVVRNLQGSFLLASRSLRLHTVNRVVNFYDLNNGCWFKGVDLASTQGWKGLLKELEEIIFSSDKL